jgi:hypothetical protein
MKHASRILAIGLLVLSPFIESCKKSGTIDPQPTQSLAHEVAGTYQLTYAKASNGTLSMQDYAGTIVAESLGDEAVGLTLTIMEKATKEKTEVDMGHVVLIRQGNKIKLSAEGQNAGSYQDGAIEILATAETGAIVLRGKK